MIVNISSYTKSLVIQAWLTGKTRDKIASEYNMSTGTVSNIIAQWKNMIGSYDAASLRELGLGLKKIQISPVECITGLRILNLINQFAIDEDHLFDFLNKLYIGCKDQGVQPDDVAKLLKEIIAFPDVNSIKEIPTGIKKRRREKIELDMEIYHLSLEIENLKREKERMKIELHDLQNNLESFKQKNRNEQKDFLLFQDMKNELEKNNISIQDLESLINVIRIFKDDYNLQPIKIM
jgi:hypothetical protein